MSGPTAGSSYTVQQGDTLFGTAQKAYGDGNLSSEWFFAATVFSGNSDTAYYGRGCCDADCRCPA